MKINFTLLIFGVLCLLCSIFSDINAKYNPKKHKDYLDNKTTKISAEKLKKMSGGKIDGKGCYINNIIIKKGKNK